MVRDGRRLVLRAGDSAHIEPGVLARPADPS